VVAADEEEFICELQGLSTGSPVNAPEIASQRQRRIINPPLSLAHARAPLKAAAQKRQFTDTKPALRRLGVIV
jgi:hypothetical protein